MNADEVIGDQSTRPKKAFLRRGEGTRRRVYASKYLEEAKRLREENQQKAQSRQNLRNESPALETRTGFVEHDSELTEESRQREETSELCLEDRFVSLVNTKSSILSPRKEIVKDDDSVRDHQAYKCPESNNGVEFIFGANHPTLQNLSSKKKDSGLHSSLSSLQQNVIESEDESGYPVLQFIDEQDIVEQKNKTEELPETSTGVDGTCRVSSDIAHTSEDNFAVENDERSLLKQERRKANWLESQRLCEERQWAEALELQEFEALEKQIVRDTKEKLEKTQDAFKRKKVSFQEPSGNPEPPSETPVATSSFTNGVLAAEGAKRTSERKELRQQKVQNLKPLSTSKRRISSKSSVQDPESSCSAGKFSPKISKAASKTERSPCSRTSSTNKVNEQEADFKNDVVVDSTFLDQLIAKDFKSCQDILQQSTNHKDNSDLLSEKLKLQSMKDDLEAEKSEWEQKQASVMSQFEAMKTEELKKLKRERRVLGQQSKALLKLPNKKERSEIESLEAIIDQERKESKSREARHKLTVERLRDQINQLQISNKELQDEIKWHEELHLLEDNKSNKEHENATPLAVEKTDMATQTGPMHRSSSSEEQSRYEENREKWCLRLENPFYSESSVGDQPVKFDHSTGYPESTSKIIPDYSCASQGADAVHSCLTPPQNPATLFLNSFLPGENSALVMSMPEQIPYTLTQKPPLPQLGFAQQNQVLQLSNGIGVASNHLFTDNNTAWNPPAVTGNTVGTEAKRILHSLPVFQPYSVPPFATSHLAATNTGLPAFATHEPPPVSMAFVNELNTVPCGVSFSQKPQYPNFKQQPHTLGFYSNCTSMGNNNFCDIPQFQFRDIGYTGHALFQPHTEATEQSMCQADRNGNWTDCTTTKNLKSETTPYEDGNQLHSQSAIRSKTDQGSMLMAATTSTEMHTSSLQSFRTNSIPLSSCADDMHRNESYTSAKEHSKLQDAVSSARISKPVTKKDPQVSSFDNGTVKQTYSDGRVVVWFANSDVKQVHPCGRVEYYYANLNTWQVTHENKIEVFYFDIGQVEAHKPSGDKDIVFPDGSIRSVLKNGLENEVDEDEVVPELLMPKPRIPKNKPEGRSQRQGNRNEQSKHQRTRSVV